MNKKNIPLLEINNLRETKLDFVIESMEEIEIKIDKNDLVPHRHDYYTIIWIKNAIGTHSIDFIEYNITPNSLYFLNPNQIHLLSTEKNPVGYVLMFKKEILTNNDTKDAIKNLNDIFYKSNVVYNFNDCNSNKLLSKYQSIIDLILETYNEYNHYLYNFSITSNNQENKENGKDNITNNNGIKSNSKNDTEYVISKLLAILLKYSLELINSHVPKTFNSNSEIIFDSFNNLVSNKYMENHQVNYYAKILNLSPDYLSKVIKEVSGKSAKDIITDRILLEAKRYIFHTSCSLKEISYHLGFQDEVQFSKFFKKNTGQTFKDFKKNI